MRRSIRARVLPVAAAAAAVVVVPSSVASARSLPDNRGYEMVTPGADKGAGWVTIDSPVVSADGLRVAYPANSPFGDARHGVGGIGGGLSYIAARSDGGWRSTFTAGVPTLPTTLWEFFLSNLWGTSPDVSRVFLDVTYGVPGYTSGAWESDATGQTSLIAATQPGAPSNVRSVSSSNDGSIVVLESRSSIPYNSIPGNPSILANATLLYQSLPDGSLRLVNVDDSGQLLNTSGAVSALRLKAPVSARNAVSFDGSRIFFLSQRPDETPNIAAPKRLYVRIDDARTFEVSASVNPAPQPPAANVLFAGANADGTRAYFTSTTQLTGDETGAGPYLYEFSLPEGASSGELRLVAGNGHPVQTSHVAPAGSRLETDVAQVLVSDRGDRVYYASTDDGGSIYVYDRSTDSTRLVASSTGGTILQTRRGGGNEAGADGADASQDGRFLAFLASASLTGGSNTRQQLYRYDAQTGDLTLVSTGPTAPAAFDSSLISYPRYSRNMPNEANIISDDGRYVFFETAAGLVDSDDNGLTDVYRWHDGDVSLLSDGRGTYPAYLVGASADGTTAFLGTNNDLLPRQDGDDLYDIYAARIGGGFPDPPERSTCTAGTCQGPGTPSPFIPVPVSSVLSGAGNVEDEDKPDARFSVRKVSSRAKRRLARTGKVTVVVRTSADGWVNATLSSKLGKTWVRSSSSTKGLRKAGTARIRATLSKRARKYLATHKKGMRVRIDVTYSAADAPKRASFKIRRAVTPKKKASR